MKFAKIEVKTENGWKSKYVKFEEEWKFGKYLCRYYKGKEYSWEEMDEKSANMLIKAYKVNFKLID